MKKLFALPMIWLILGAVAIATEIKTNDLLPAKQQLSGAVITCLKGAVDKKEASLISASTTYQSGYITALTARKAAIFTAWSKTTKKDIKAALGEAAKVYKTTFNTLKKDLKASQKSTSATFKAEVKACKPVGLQDLAEINNMED